MVKKINADIRQELNVFYLGENINECQRNYLEHILRMSTYGFPRKFYDHNPKGRRDIVRPRKGWEDQFIYQRNRNRSKGLKLVADDDEDES
jgi:hypothetical protein